VSNGATGLQGGLLGSSPDAATEFAKVSRAAERTIEMADRTLLPGIEPPFLSGVAYSYPVVEMSQSPFPRS
jgi:hypothetical protein